MRLTRLAHVQPRDRIAFKNENFFVDTFDCQKLTEDTMTLTVSKDMKKQFVEPAWDGFTLIVVGKREIPEIARTVLVLCALPTDLADDEWPSRDECYSILLVYPSSEVVYTYTDTVHTDFWPLVVEYFTDPVTYDGLHIMPSVLRKSLSDALGIDAVSGSTFSDLQIAMKFHVAEAMQQVYKWVLDMNIESFLEFETLIMGYMGFEPGDIEVVEDEEDNDDEWEENED